MIPKLFAATATTFTTQGIGALTDSILCYVDEERNGEYEGYLRYPITGVHYADIALRSIIVMKPNFTDDPQPFRVYDITKPLNGVVTVRFRHISYDLSGYPVEPFTASTLSGALSGLVSNCPVDCPFTLTSSRSVSATFKANVPASIRSWMGGKKGSLLDVYGGEWKYDGFTASLPSSRGQNRGVTIRYGKNLTALEQEENNAAVYTGVYPYWTDAYGENLVQITGRIVHNTDTPTYSGATYDYERILPLDLSSKWEEAPSEGELRSAAIAYIEDNEIGTPKVNLRVEFAQVSKLVRDQVDLCDTVTVQFEKLGVTATAKCIRTKWNVLLDRYEEITLGDAKTNLAGTIVNTKKTAETAVSPSALEIAVDQATAQITGANGGYTVWHDSNQDGQPDELLVMDTPSIETAVKVWRFNKNGLGFSATGYDGEYALAMTADGAIVADMITVGTLSATLMRAGILKSLNYDSSGGTAGFSMNMETGEIFAPALVISAKNYTDTEVANALATAAADATSKANAAQTAAENYTDTQISVIPGQISSAISDIRIGGRNILKNSGTCGTLRLWAGASEHGGTMTIVRNVSVEEWNCDDAVRVYGKSGSTSTLFGLIDGVYAASTISIPDEKYVFSIFAKNNGSSNYIVFSPNSLAPNITIQPQETKRIVQVATGDGISFLQFAFYTNAIGNNYDITFWHPQIEYGNKVTDWSPAPEDIYADYNYKFNTVEQNISSLNQTAASISSEVSKKVNTTVYNANNQAVSQQISSLSSRIDQTAGSIRGIVSEEISGLEDQAESISNWFDFSVSNFLTIGQAGSAYKTQITNSAFNILHGSSVIGSFSNSGLDTSAITLDTSLSLPPFTLESINNGTEWLLTE